MSASVYKIIELVGVSVGVATLACVSLAVQEHSAPKVRRPPDVLADDEARAVEL